MGIKGVPMEELLGKINLAELITILTAIVATLSTVIGVIVGVIITRSVTRVQIRQAKEQISLTRLEREIKEKELRISAVRDNLAGANYDLDRRITELQHAEEQYNNQDEIISDINNEIYNSERDIERSKIRINQLKNRRTQQKSKLEDYEKDKNEVSRMIIRTRDAIRHIRDELDEMQRE